MYNVHVHTDDAGEAIELAIAAGRPRNIRVTSLDAQVQAMCIGGQARGVRVAEREGETAARTAVVAVAPGLGVAELFRSLGAVVIPGGGGRNPSVGDLLEGVGAAGAESVLLLPNHPDVRAAADGAAAEAGIPVRVVATSSVAEGLAAAASVIAEDDLDENVRRAAEAARGVASGEVVRAARDSDTSAGPVRRGEYLGMAGGTVVAVGDDAAAVAVQVATSLRRDRHELLTLISGDGVEDGSVALAVEALAPTGVEVETHHGGQPSPFLIGLE
jgi:dihydroxyacetone kinase-like predicted kinase